MYIWLHMYRYVYVYIYIYVVSSASNRTLAMALAKGIWVGCLGKNEWRLTMTSIRFAISSAPKWINHDQRWAGQKLCRSSSKDWRPKSYHWTLATTIQGVAHLEMFGRTCLKGICRIECQLVGAIWYSNLHILHIRSYTYYFFYHIYIYIYSL